MNWKGKTVILLPARPASRTHVFRTHCLKVCESVGRIEFLASAFSLISSPFVVFLDVFNWLVFYPFGKPRMTTRAFVIDSAVYRTSPYWNYFRF